MSNDTSLLGPCIARDIIQNRMLSESPVYTVTNFVLTQLAQRLQKNVLVAPQFNIYTSSLDDEIDDPDTSIITRAESTTHDVTVDAALLCPALALRRDMDPDLGINSVQSVIELANSGQLPFWLLEIPHMFAWVLDKTTRSPKRTHKSAEYADDIYDLFTSVQTQAQMQAQCLFSSRRFAGQPCTISKITAGTWWMYRVIHRNSIHDVFDLRQYITAQISSKEHDEIEGDADFQIPSSLDTLSESLDRPRVIIPVHKDADLIQYWATRHPKFYNLPPNLNPIESEQYIGPLRLGTDQSNEQLQWIETFLQEKLAWFENEMKVLGYEVLW